MYRNLNTRLHQISNEMLNHPINSNEWYVLAEEHNGICEFVECSKDNYEFVNGFAKQHGFDVVYDIGCAFGIQSEVFLHSEIDYVGIEGFFTLPYWNADKFQYIQKKYPFEIIPKGQNPLAVSILCLGWNCYKFKPEEWDNQFRQLSKDFPNALVYMQAEAVKVARKYYPQVQSCGYDHFYWLTR